MVLKPPKIEELFCVTALIFILFLTLLFAFCEKGYCEDFTKCKAVLHCRKNVGMFSMWMDVLSLCREYEKGNIGAIDIDFDDTGLYYSPEHGKNWWTYYCEPICRCRENGSESIRGNARDDSEIDYEPFCCDHQYDLRYIIGDIPGSNECMERTLTRYQAHDLIEKYIHVKPEILAEVEEFARDNFTAPFLITVHFRGTDKYQEAPRIKWKMIKRKIMFLMRDPIYKNCKIFIATDETNFIKYMKDNFEDRICYRDCERTEGKEGLHYVTEDIYQQGRDAVIDMLLLSKGDILIRTSSNLSRWSTWFNPNNEVYELCY